MGEFVENVRVHQHDVPNSTFGRPAGTIWECSCGKRFYLYFSSLTLEGMRVFSWEPLRSDAKVDPVDTSWMKEEEIKKDYGRDKTPPPNRDWVETEPVAKKRPWQFWR